MSSSELRLRARARALRAAQAVTLGSALAACGSSHTPITDASMDAPIVADSGRDSGRDSGHDSGSDSGHDAGSDAALDAALVCPPIFPPTTQECCEAEPGGFWDGEQCIVAVPGPFVPPRMA